MKRKSHQIKKVLSKLCKFKKMIDKEPSSFFKSKEDIIICSKQKEAKNVWATIKKFRYWTITEN